MSGNTDLNRFNIPLNLLINLNSLRWELRALAGSAVSLYILSLGHGSCRIMSRITSRCDCWRSKPHSLSEGCCRGSMGVRLSAWLIPSLQDFYLFLIRRLCRINERIQINVCNKLILMLSFRSLNWLWRSLSFYHPFNQLFSYYVKTLVFVKFRGYLILTRTW
jgi:hypothetical protein